MKRNAVKRSTGKAHSIVKCIDGNSLKFDCFLHEGKMEKDSKGKMRLKRCKLHIDIKGRMKYAEGVLWLWSIVAEDMPLHEHMTCSAILFKSWKEACRAGF